MKTGLCLSTREKFLPLAFACFLGGLPCSGVSQVSESARQCFEWFGTLGYPDFKEARWAEVWTGDYFFKGGGMPARTSIPAFVIGEAGEEFTVVAPSLIQRTLRKTAEGTPSDKRIDFEERPFRPFVEDRIQKLRQKDETISTVSFNSRLDLKSETFVLAYVCWVKGEPDLAGRLYALAEGLPIRVDGREKSKPMREALEIELGHLEMWRAVLECGGRTFRLMSYWDESTPTLKPRKELAEAFRRIERSFPASPHVGKAAEMAALLERMVEEDNEHPAIPPDEWDELPQDRQVAELVWLLRDQNGHQFSQPGWCDVFGTSNDGDSPAHQLWKIGYPAVPALIEALSDQRLSRSVGYHRNFYFSHSVLTVGDCAQQILDRISGRSFYTPASTSSYMAKELKAVSVQEQARAWWAEFQSKGKEQMLIDTIASGEISPRPLVRQLKEEAPEAVADAVMRGAEAASRSGRNLSGFIDELAGLPSPESIRFLKVIALEHSDLNSRLHAAECLLKLDFNSALSALLAAWEHFPPNKDETGGRDGFSKAVHLLVVSGDPKAMRMLVSDWESRSLNERFEIVKTLGDPRREFVVNNFVINANEPPPETQVVAIELLVRALEDSEVRQNLVGVYNDFEYKNPQVGDLALYALNQIDGERFPFPPGTGRRLLDLQRIEAANRWRVQHGMSPLPLPEPPGPVLSESDALKIAKVTVEPEKLAEAPLAARALGWKGKDLEEKALLELLHDYFKEPVASTMGLVVEVYRRSDLTGVEVALTFREGYAEESERWSMRCRGMAGEVRTARANDNGMDPQTKTAEAWNILEKVIHEALSLPPVAPFGFEASIRASGVSISF